MIRRIGLGMLLAILLATLGSAAWLAGTEAGARVLVTWTSGLLPYVKLRHESGSLAGPLRLHVVDIKLKKVRVHINDLRIDWSLACLLVGEACIRDLSAERLQITLSPPTAAKPGTPPAPFRMPQLRLPLVIDAGRVHFAELEIVRGDKPLVTLIDIDTALRWSDGVMAIDHLRAAMPRWEAGARGSLATTGDWDLDLHCRFRAPRQGPSPFTLDGRARGSLVDLHLDADSGGFINAKLGGVFALFAPGLPFSADATAPQWRVPASAPDEKATRINDIRLRAEGLLTGQFRLAGEASVDTPWMPPLPVQLDGQATVRGVRQGVVTIADPRLQASLATQYDWVGAQEFTVDAAIGHLDLSLFSPALSSSLAGDVRLDGLVDAGETDLRIDVATLDGRLRDRAVRANGKLRWHEGRLQFDAVSVSTGTNRARLDGELADRWNVDAALDLSDLRALHPSLAGTARGRARITGEPADPRFGITLQTTPVSLPEFPLPVAGTRQILRLPTMEWLVSADAGLNALRINQLQATGDDFRLDATGDIAWRDGIDASIRANLFDFPLQRLSTELGGRLGGPLQVTGRWKDALASLQLDTALEGTLDGLPLALRADLDYEPGALHIRSGRLTHGNNRLRAAGRLSAKDVDLEITAEAPELARSFRDFSGNLSGRARLLGTPERPEALLALELGKLEAGTFSLERGSLALTLQDGGHLPSQLSLMARGARRDTTVPADLVLLGEGTRDAHRLSLDARQSSLLVSLATDGRLPPPATGSPDWQGVLRSGVLQWNDWRWNAVGEPALAVRDKALHLDEHCWTDAIARTCLTAPAILGSTGTLQAEAFHLSPGMLVADYLPMDSLASGQIGALFRAQWADAALQSLSVDLRNATPLVFSEPRDDGSLREIARIETLAADGSLNASEGRLQLGLSGEALGSASAIATLDTRSGAIAGQVDIARFNLGIADAFTYLAHDSGGTLQARIGIDGTLAEPRLTGAASVTDGRLSFVRVPVTLEQIRLDGRFDGHRMRLDGSLRTNRSPEDVLIGGDFRLDQGRWHGTANAKGRALVFSIPPQIDVTTAPDLRARLRDRDWLLEGSVGIPHARIDIRSLPTQSVELSRDVILLREETEAGARNRLVTFRSDIALQLGNDVRFSAFGAEGLLAGNLRLRKRPDLPMLVDGELLIREGSYGIFGQTLALRQASLIFNGPVDQPLIDALAVREINDPAMKEAGVELTGSLRRPETKLWSMPEVPQNEALTWLLTGRAPSDDPINYRGEAASAALSLGVAQGSALLNQAGKKLGLKEFQLSAGGDGDETEVEVGTAVSERLYLGYNRRVFSGEDSLLVRLRMTRRLVMEAVSGLESALDVYYTFEF